MSLMHQIVWGSVFLGLCMLLQVACLALSIPVLIRTMRRMAGLNPALQITITLSVALMLVVLALSIQIWIWSLVWVGYGVLPDWNSAVYFSLVTFTTVGYGDIVLPPEARIFAGLGGVTGVLGFGLSTAYLVALTSRLLGEIYRSHRSGANRRASGAP